MTTSIDNVQRSLALVQWIPLSGTFPARDGPGTGEIPMGSIRTFAGTFSPNGAPDAGGQLLSIAQNTALFSLLGTTYGGDGRTTFALPDLDARAAIGVGHGPGLHDYLLGEESGTATLTLTREQMPTRLGGNGSPIDNVGPSLTITNIIRTTGAFPSTGGGGTNFVGEVVKFAGNFIPAGFMEAAGQILPIDGNETLFALVGTAYGGNGVTTFALPDLRGRNIIGASGTAPLGSLVGSETITLSSGQLPSAAGGSDGFFDNRAPGLAMTYMIALQGYFPPHGGSGGAPSDMPYVGEITTFVGDFAPRGWAKCEGQILPIAQNQALFSLLGTTYGGDGIRTFALPDLRGRTVVGADDGLPPGSVLGSDVQGVGMSDIPGLDYGGTNTGETLFGGGNGDRLHGLGGDDTLIGNAGDDILVGDWGADTMIGGAGNDTYYVDNAGDVVIEAPGAGTDIVHTSVSYTLAAGQEVEVLQARTASATTPLALTGNAFAQIITGNAGDNVIDGKEGADDMRGLGGNDVYFVDDAGDKVREAVGGGHDTVYASVNYALIAGQEIETLAAAPTGTAPLRLTGNAFGQTIAGNAGDNVLDGRGGADVLRGLSGDDTLIGGDGADRLVGGLGADRLKGGAGADVFAYASVAESNQSGSGRDVILDFSAAEGDKISLNTIDARADVIGNQAFSFIGTAGFSRHSGELRYAAVGGNVYVYGDTDGDGSADFSVQVNGIASIQASDFVL